MRGDNLWASYRRVQLVISTNEGSLRVDLPTPASHPIFLALDFRLETDGGIILDSRVLSIRLQESEIEFR